MHFGKILKENSTAKLKKQDIRTFISHFLFQKVSCKKKKTMSKGSLRKLPGLLTAEKKNSVNAFVSARHPKFFSVNIIQKTSIPTATYQNCITNGVTSSVGKKRHVHFYDH